MVIKRLFEVAFSQGGSRVGKPKPATPSGYFLFNFAIEC